MYKVIYLIKSRLFSSLPQSVCIFVEVSVKLIFLNTNIFREGNYLWSETERSNGFELQIKGYNHFSPSNGGSLT